MPLRRDVLYRYEVLLCYLLLLTGFGYGKATFVNLPEGRVSNNNNN